MFQQHRPFQEKMRILFFGYANAAVILDVVLCAAPREVDRQHMGAGRLKCRVITLRVDPDRRKKSL
jgi:hypothetical protein